jgi:FtsP/CotA-like multicopper oxidase with cupredoxin domain
MDYQSDCSVPHVIRTFDIEAISLPIVYNKYGDHDPNGLLYVLFQDSERIQQKAKENFMLSPPQPYEEVRPLVIRANVGDEIHVYFHNKLDRRTSIHVQGLRYDIATSDGANVGYNPDTTTDDTILYTWYAEREGVYLFNDMADVRSGEEGTNVHGLFGAIIVEEAGAKWRDPVTGKPMESGLFADIYTTDCPAFREYVVFFHDEMEIKNKEGQPPTDPHTALPRSTMGISYRSEPMRNREPLMPEGHEEHMEDILTGEDISMSSWVYGDPDPPLPKAYVGDPAKFHLIHAGVMETHVFHLHTHQWRLEPDDPNSTIIDSISISPQECYTLDILYGAGSLNRSIGDVIFHCHLYPHFMEGMWTLWRIFDRLEDGSSVYPDGTSIQALMPLADRLAPPSKDADHPGFPNFINGQFGERPPQPPLGILTPEGENKIDPTPLEIANFISCYAPGQLYSEACSCCQEVKVYEVAVVQAKLVYNSYGWHDPQGRFFVLKEDIEREGTLEAYIAKVESGEIQPEPLIIRANIGDCIEIRTTNLLPEFLEASAFQPRTLTDIVGFHIHLVKFDTIVSDGSANGYCNIAGARQFETLIERFYVNEELNTVFFHDHLFPNSHQQHGMFGALIVEPTGATYHHPKTGEELKSGTQAVIRLPDGSAYREFALFVHDFTLLFDKNGNPLNPPEHPGSDDDPGVMGINYRSEPMRERLKIRNYPSHIFSSHVYGDPATPLLETYPGEPMIIRLIDGAHEEQHAFNLTGMSWHKEITDVNSPIVSEQTIGISEAFNIRIDQSYAAGDYLYYFGGIDDVWLGLWGIIRSYSKLQPHLPTLNGKLPAQVKPLIPPKGAFVRKFEIAAVQSDIQYNQYGDHDPEGLLFVPLDEADDVICGRKKPVPLILRANKGDWIEVTLHNMFNPLKPIKYNDYPSVPLDMFHTPSNQVSLQPQFLQHDPVNSSGLNVGYNEKEQTVPPGGKIRYLWYADREYGACLLSSFGDLRNHRNHGLFGAIIIEPKGLRYFNEVSFFGNSHNDQAIISVCGIEPFREFVLFAQNGIRLLDARGKIIKTTEMGEPGEHDPDHEDTGEKGYNYRSERLFNRLSRVPVISKVFSSKTHGDPSTPIFNAYCGERVIIRLLMTGDKPRNIGFTLHGHTWKAQIGDSLSRVISTQGAISVGGVYNIELEGGANQHKGDYLYRSGSLKWDVESGMWGILRIKKHNMLWYCQRIFSAAGNRLRNLRRVKKNVDMDRGLKTGATNNNND